MSGLISPNAATGVEKFSFSETAGTVGNGIKTGFTWIVDKIKVVAGAVFSFVRDTAFPFVKDSAVKTVAFLRTNAGAAVVGAVGTAGLLYTASKVKEDNNVLKIGLYVASGATLALTVTATVLGFNKGFSTNIV